MDFLAGKRLAALAVALMALAAAAAARVAVSGDPWTEPASVASAVGPSAVDHLVRARAAERRGDVTEALARYREAVRSNPRLVDRKSSEYLGSDFEGKLRSWVAGLREKKIPAGPTALPDASYLFRRMYGGCG
ncbi:MAG: hypothetical protein HZA60_05050 [Deltaproteobacteria bacterium]|nr:hypothetical protein [Deltaproteobacteria bacterium]